MKDSLERGRDAYRRRAWRDAHEALSLADRGQPLGAEDLERLATAAYLIGRDLEHGRFLDRAYHARLEGEDPRGAARCAFWAGLVLFLRGDTAQASGWLARGRRLVGDLDCAEAAYFLLSLAQEQIDRGHWETACETSSRAAAVGDRFGDADLSACARHLQGRALLLGSRVPSGLVLLDEAMLAAVGGELSPIMTGLVYCSLIEACQDVYAFERAREWTAALARWCGEQPQMIAFTATCLVRRAQVLTLCGRWAEAMAETRRACEGPSREEGRRPPAAAYYQRADLQRLRGEFAAAETSYREVARLGGEPQPGLALLRLAQGRRDAACAAIRRIVGATKDPRRRARLLPAQIDILLAAGETGDARTACLELEGLAEDLDSDVLRATAERARGAIELSEGDAEAALPFLRRALDLWQRVDAPHEVARVRMLVAEACRSLGDEEAACLETDAARAAFERLGAAPDLARLEAEAERGTRPDRRGLTSRELEVLRLIATGMTNKAIAMDLRLSERTVDRHVSNILGKLGVPSRAAAIAHGYRHELL